jgi:hypothetical protein
MGFKEHPKSLLKGKLKTILDRRVDTGELVCREDQESESSMKLKPQRAGPGDSQSKGDSTEFLISDEVTHTTSSKGLKRKRRHRANPIDDLFNTLA